jgi:hypothetical protein
MWREECRQVLDKLDGVQSSDEAVTSVGNIGMSSTLLPIYISGNFKTSIPAGDEVVSSIFFWGSCFPTIH